MKRRIFTALLAGAMLLSLAACGGSNNGGGSSSNPGSSSSDNSGASSSLPDGSQPDASNPDGSNPDGSNPDGSASEPVGGSASSSEGTQPDGSAGDTIQPLPTVTLTLNRTSVSLNKAGATFKLRCTTDPETDDAPTYTSSNQKVATVDKNGTIKAVAPGKATITVECAGATAKASVTCSWTEETKPDTSKPSGSSSSSNGSSSSSGGASSGGGSSSEAPAPVSVDLSSFYSTITGKYEFGFLELADSTILDQLYAGLTGVSTEQRLVYVCPMTMNNGEFGLIQVKDSKDVDTVKAAFQARIDYMVGDGNGPGGAYYPAAMDQWEFNSRVVSNGNYVMLVVHENCDSIVNDFNALF